jgi:hypothetical protein
MRSATSGWSGMNGGCCPRRLTEWATDPGALPPSSPWPQLRTSEPQRRCDRSGTATLMIFMARLGTGPRCHTENLAAACCAVASLSSCGSSRDMERSADVWASTRGRCYLMSVRARPRAGRAPPVDIVVISSLQWPRERSPADRVGQWRSGQPATDRRVLRPSIIEERFVVPVLPGRGDRRPS